MEEKIVKATGGSDRVYNQVFKKFSGSLIISKLRNFNITTIVYL